ncbi:hypothetical protein [uncultured Desulfuromusa sp.]|uniref:hypothetical protein n=1 Tax=uncultured Desulfuromusa sp. TaxID=219183 RepID=UPI002AA8B47C|nr:hypothetical protein [uncultured Desulfuromusa sp.]
MAIKRCQKCEEPLKGEFWCSHCKTVFKCPIPGCGATIKPGATECHRCGLFFEDYLNGRKMYRRCPKCKKKQGLSEQQCRFCHHWFNCPTCGEKVSTNTVLTCPRCGTSLR